METGKKAALGATLVLVAAVGIRVGLIYRERHEGDKAVALIRVARQMPTGIHFLHNVHYAYR